MPYPLFLLFLLLAGCGGGSPTTPTAVPSSFPTPFPRQVVIVSIDGLRPDALSKTDTGNIQALAARGAYTWEARTIMPSGSGSV